MRLAWIAIAAAALCCLAPAAARAGEQEERDAIYAEARDDFVAGRFDRLEERAEDFRTNERVTASGVPKLTVVVDSFAPKYVYDSGSDEERFARYATQLADWRKAYPFSSLASVLTAREHQRRAWAIRGHGFASTVPAEAWPGFFEQIGLARKELERSRSFSAEDPEWYREALDVARDDGLSRVARDRLAEEALARHPRHIAIWHAILIQKLARWGGSPAEFDDAVDRIVARTATVDGQTAYARSYWWLADIEHGAWLFKRTLAKWPRMKQGFEDVVARYPTDWNLNIYAAFACIADDMPTLRALLKRLDGRLIERHWKSMRSSETCIELANREQVAAEDIAHYQTRRETHAAVMEDRRLIWAIEADFIAGRFDRLEAAHEEFLRTRARTLAGTSKLALFYRGLTPAIMSWTGRELRTDLVEAQNRKWREAFPSSAAAMIAEARFSLRAAEFEAFAASEANPRTAAKAKLLARTRRQLDETREAAGHDPAWWSTLLRAETADVYSEPHALELARQALARAPDYDEIRSAVLSRTTFGSKSMASAVALVVNAAPDAGKAAAYAESYAMIHLNWNIDVFRYAEADWPRLREGFEAVVAERPTDWNLNAYLSLACRAKDRPTARMLLDRLEGRIIEERWIGWREPIACAEWAKQDG